MQLFGFLLHYYNIIIITYTIIYFCGNYRHGDLSKPSTKAKGRVQVIRKWEELTNILNSEGSGEPKTLEKWKKVPVACFFIIRWFRLIVLFNYNKFCLHTCIHKLHFI